MEGYSSDVVRKNNIKKKRNKKESLERKTREEQETRRNTHTESCILRGSHTVKEKRRKDVRGIKPSFRGPYLGLAIRDTDSRGVFVQPQV